MPELIAHLFGDYVLQNHRMALRKTSSSLWAAVHVGFYLLPFLLLTRSLPALAVIAGTHFVIDRFRMARHWVEFWGVGCDGALPRFLDHLVYLYRRRYGVVTIETLDPAPPFLAVWLLILVDNTFHILINHLSLVWL